MIRIKGGEYLETAGRIRAVASDGVVIGLLGFADRVRPEAAAALQALRDTGTKRLVMRTGDHAASAQRIAHEVGINEVHMAGGMFIHQISVLVVAVNGMRLMRTRRPRGRDAATVTGRPVRAA